MPGQSSRVYVGLYRGYNRGYMGIMEKRMETTILGLGLGV